MATGSLIATVLGDWASLYNNHKAVLGAVTFGHLAGLLLGGGSAVSFDLETLRLAHASAGERAVHLAGMGRTHRWVLTGLSLVVISGFLMVFADVSTFLRSPIFWTKMGIVVLLLSNGVLITRPVPPGAAGAEAGWRRVEVTAAVSLCLWLAATLVGVMLMAMA